MTIVAHTVCSQTRDSQIAEETKRQKDKRFKDLSFQLLMKLTYLSYNIPYSSMKDTKITDTK